jgi:3-methylfumaryl-CoA hydratase
VTDWRPSPQTSVETVQAGRVAALTALLDSGAPPVGPGDPLPPLWHWVALPRWPRSAALGADGHPRKGGFLPDLGYPRRMFAGGEVVLHRPVEVGGEVHRESVVESVEEKQGRSGPFAVVRVRTTLSDSAGTLLVEEWQDLVYRPAGAPPAGGSVPDAAAPAERAPVGPPLREAGKAWCFRTDPTLLMRFSAATANPHRIHYDWPYATRVEGYPDLVVHGPLSTLVLAEALRLSLPGQTVRRLRHRNSAPLFCGQNALVSVDQSLSPHVEVTLRGGDDTPLAGLSAELASHTGKA